MSYDENINMIKKDIAERLKISVQELEEEIDEIKSEAPGLITDKVALMILMERRGITDPEIVKKLTTEYAILRISDLSPGMFGITVMGRIIRETRSQKNDEKRVIIDDGSGRALIIISGRNKDMYKKIGFEPGDILLIRNAKVLKKYGLVNYLIADDESELLYIEETDMLQYPLGFIPQKNPPLTIKEVYKIAKELVDEGSEIDVRGIVSWIGKVDVVKRNTKKEVKKLTLRLRDEVDENISMRVIVWGDNASHMARELIVGVLLLLEGAVVKKNEFLSRKLGEEVIELHAGNLSNYKILDVKRDKITELKPGSKAVIFGFVLGNPRIRTYTDSEGKERSYMVFYVGDETGNIRVVTWKEEEVSKLSKLGNGDKVLVKGVVKESKFGKSLIEMHVSTQGDNVIVDPKLFPKDLTIEKVQKGDKGKEGLEAREIKTVDVFTDLPLDAYVNLKGFFVELRELTKEGGPIAVARIQDKLGNEVALMIWDTEILNAFSTIRTGEIIIVKNAKTPKEDRGRGPVVFLGRRSEIISVGKRSEEDDYEYEISLRPIRDAKENPHGFFFGTVIDVEFIGRMRFCKECGFPIISSSEEGEVCLKGHISEGKEKLTVVLVVDDDIEAARIYVTGKYAVNLLNETGFLVNEILINDDLKELVKSRIIGQEIIFNGEMSEESVDTNYVGIVKEILKPDPNKLIKIIEKET